MAAATDELITKLDLLGLGAYTSGLGRAASAVGILEGRLDALATKRLGFAFAGGAVGLGVLDELYKSTLKAGEGQATLNTAVNNFKGRTSAGELQNFADGLSRLTGVDDDRIVGFLGELGTFRIKPQDAQALALPILNATVALRAQGITADQLALQIGKAYETGEPTALRRSGIILDENAFKAANAAERVKLLAKALNEQGGAHAAEEFRKTLPGAIQAAETALENFEKGVGGAFVQPFTAGLNAATGLVNRLNDLDPTTLKGIGYAAAAAGVALVGLSLRTGYSVYKAASLAGENAKLTNEQLKTGVSANKQAEAEGQDAAAMGLAATEAVGLTSKLELLARAHDQVTAAATRGKLTGEISFFGSELPAVAGAASGGESAAPSAVALAEEGAAVAAGGVVANAAASKARQFRAVRGPAKGLSVGDMIRADLAQQAKVEQQSVDDAIGAYRSGVGANTTVAQTVAADLAGSAAAEEAGVDAAILSAKRRAQTSLSRRLLTVPDAPAQPGFFSRLFRAKPSAVSPAPFAEAEAAAGGGEALATGAAGAGALARGGQFLKGPGGILLATTAAELAVGAIPTKPGSGGDEFKSVAQGALGGAGIGATVGSFIPGIGTAIGAGVGALAGGGYALASAEGEKSTEKEKAARDPQLAQLQRTNELLTAQLEELKGLRRGGIFDNKDIPGAVQLAAVTLGRAVA